MSTVRRGGIVRTLSKRVHARVRGSGGSRDVVEGVAEPVVDALEERRAGATERNAWLVAVLAGSHPPSRLAFTP